MQQSRAHWHKEDKVRAAIFGGAIGDALGAPLEGEWNFGTLLRKFGPKGVQGYVDCVSPSDNKPPLGFKPGDTTDDTACTVGVIAALENSRGRDPGHTVHQLWQANIIWAAHQRGDEKTVSYAGEIANYIDPTISWPEWYIPFFNNIGAGNGTLSTLATGRKGTPELPISPNVGCGGMMRVAPIALLPLEDDYEVIDLAMRSTALTHGAEVAQAATVAVALTIRKAFNGVSLQESAKKAIRIMQDLDIEGTAECEQALTAAQIASATKPVNCKTAESLPGELGYHGKDQFKAIPVLSQVFYGAFIADYVRREFRTNHEAFLETLGIVATISGDSDSTGAIVGNILGAAWGTKALPADLWRNVSYRGAIENAVLSLNQTIEEMQYEPA